MNILDKIRYFDYFISQIIGLNTSTEITPSQVLSAVSKYKLSKLKLLKLLFFASVVNVDGKYLLDDVFDKFYAMPYGPVESDVYDHISMVTNYAIDNRSICLRNPGSVISYNESFSKEICQRISESVKKLYDINPSLFTMSSFDLVELSHKADSWRIVYSAAQRQGKFSLYMPHEIIKSTTVYFK
jgi:uncharacterized phage-associated protein